MPFVTSSFLLLVARPGVPLVASLLLVAHEQEPGIPICYFKKAQAGDFARWHSTVAQGIQR